MRERLPLRELGAALPAAFVPLEWPLRLPQVGLEDFVVRALEAPLDGRTLLPLPRLPLLCAPLVELLAPLLVRCEPLFVPCAPLLTDRAPLFEPLPLCVPFPLCLALAPAVGFELQRAPAVDREPVAGRELDGRADALRLSELARRAGRLLAVD